MKVYGMHLVWIVVKDLDEGIKFYTETVGLTLKEKSEEYGWAELKGRDGARLGIARESDMSEIKAGENAVPTISVENIEVARAEFLKKNVNLMGDMIEIPGHVKMQTFKDQDGNMFQLCELLS